MRHDTEQYSDEWWQLREKRMTASHAQAIGANGKGLITYVRQIMAEYYSSAQVETYSNQAMANGLLLEEFAAMEYSMREGIVIEKIGFVTMGDHVGASPDRGADENGLAEIKCPTDKVYFDYLIDRKIDSKYQWQMQMQMMVCEKEWCDYVVYSPNFKESLIIKRVFPDHEKVEKLKIGIEAGIKIIVSVEKKLEHIK